MSSTTVAEDNRRVQRVLAVHRFCEVPQCAEYAEAALAASQLGAEGIIAMSRHQLAHEYGATYIVEERGVDGMTEIKDFTGGLGAHRVVEAVGTQSRCCGPSARLAGRDVGYKRS